jgi:protein arginine kinase activator
MATVRYAEVVDGKVTERLLCPECVSKLQMEDAKGFAFSSPTVSKSRPPASQVVSEAVRTQRSCPSCGILLGDILEQGKVGCAKCYEEFSDQLSPHLYDIHFTLKHKGKVPHFEEPREHLRHDLQAKRALLRKVLRAENYEKAALLRDEIRGLEQGLYLSGTGAE